MVVVIERGLTIYTMLVTCLELCSCRGFQVSVTTYKMSKLVYILLY